MINVAIGLVFIMLLLSLLATSIMELVNSILSSRGKHLEKVLGNILAPSNNRMIYEAFRANPLYQQLSGRFVGKATPPSYLTSENFREILFKVLGGKNNLEKEIDKIPDHTLKEVLSQLLEEVDFDHSAFAKKVESWYDNVMDRASGWFRRKIQARLVIVGLIIAILFNADTISIYDKLSGNPETLVQVVSLAQGFAEQEASASMAITPELNQIRDDLSEYANQEISKLKDPLGLGWDNFDTTQASWYDWVKKFLGWLVTALAISLGAPFWFDLLRRFVQIKAAGKEGGKTAETASEPAVVTPRVVTPASSRSILAELPEEMEGEKQPQSPGSRKVPVG